jgi:hypothetical protein
MARRGPPVPWLKYVTFPLKSQIMNMRNCITIDFQFPAMDRLIGYAGTNELEDINPTIKVKKKLKEK